MSMQQFNEWLRSDDEENASLATMHVLAESPVDELVTRDSEPGPLSSWSGGWN